jgi:hypothetical protein
VSVWLASPLNIRCRKQGFVVLTRKSLQNLMKTTATRGAQKMGWLTNLLKNALAQAATEVLMPQLETRMRVIVREEMRQQFEEVWLPRLRAMWIEDFRAEMQRQFEAEGFAPDGKLANWVEVCFDSAKLLERNCLRF